MDTESTPTGAPSVPLPVPHHVPRSRPDHHLLPLRVRVGWPWTPEAHFEDGRQEAPVGGEAIQVGAT